MEISRVYNWNIVIFIEWENPLYIYGFTLWQLTAAMVYRYINRLQKITMGNFSTANFHKLPEGSP